MTTEFLTIKFANFSKCYCHGIPKKNSAFGQFSLILPPPRPLQNANFINIVVSASLKEVPFIMFVSQGRWSAFRVAGRESSNRSLRASHLA